MWAKLLVVYLLPLLQQASCFGINQVTYLRPDEPHFEDVQTMLYVRNKLHVFCKQATPSSIWNVFRSSHLRLEISADGDYKQYKADSMKEVYQAHHQGKEDFEGKPLGLGTYDQRIISLSVHSDVYYGIYTDTPFVLTLEENACDSERVAQFIFGLALWACCPLLADSLLLAYCTAAALGAHFAAVAVVFLAVLESGEECTCTFARLSPLKANFKQVYEKRPTLVILMLLCGAWIVQALAKKVRFLWRYQITRILHCRLLRSVSYLLILNACDHCRYGWIVVCVLFPWPELCLLLNLLKSQYIRSLIFKRKVKEDMCINRARWVNPPRHFHQSNGDYEACFH